MTESIWHILNTILVGVAIVTIVILRNKLDRAMDKIGRMKAIKRARKKRKSDIEEHEGYIAKFPIGTDVLMWQDYIDEAANRRSRLVQGKVFVTAGNAVVKVGDLFLTSEYRQLVLIPKGDV